jgi:hypothetical protein
MGGDWREHEAAEERGFGKVARASLVSHNPFLAAKNKFN